MSAEKRRTPFGETLFRYRSFTPIPVIAGLLWLAARSFQRAPSLSWRAQITLDLLGLCLALLGQALRFYTLGLVRNGTSGQGSKLEAVALNRHGPYTRVRNPLYL